MGRKQITELTCDICGRHSKRDEDLSKWLEWSQDHPFYDRDWIERAMCPTCLNDVQVAIKNKK